MTWTSQYLRLIRIVFNDKQIREERVNIYIYLQKDMKTTLQIQSVIYENEKKSLEKALYAIRTAALADLRADKRLDKLVVCYGDASAEPIFDKEEVEELKKMFKDVFEFRYIFFDENTGSAKGHNLMGETCECEYMLIMNPDVILSSDIFEQMFKPFEADERVGMVEARQTPIEHSKDYDKVTGETEWATTACALFTKKLFDQLQGFDYETFFLYCDDLDFSWRVRLAGYKIIYQPKAVVFHAKRVSLEGKWQPTNAEKYYSAESAVFMAYKWSNNERVKMLLDMFSKSGKTERKGVEEFETRKKENRLPKQLDPEHKVARFVGDYFTEHRFYLI